MNRLLSYLCVVVFSIGGCVLLGAALEPNPKELMLAIPAMSAFLATGFLMGYWWDKPSTKQSAKRQE